MALAVGLGNLRVCVPRGVWQALIVQMLLPCSCCCREDSTSGALRWAPPLWPLTLLLPAVLAICDPALLLALLHLQ